MQTTDAKDRQEQCDLMAEFERFGLDPARVWEPASEDVAQQNRQLRSLLDWVLIYRRLPDRKELEKCGYLFPPVWPGSGPDEDWLRFERWVRGKPATWWYETECGPLPDSDSLTDIQIAVELEKVKESLAQRGVVVDLNPDVPARPVYEALCRELKRQDFEITGPATQCHLLLCSGYCPDCFQRPWCEVGLEWDGEG
ncbi:MAG: hypothetical protein JXR37_34435 [Kiritimatiellae bacterium]|nr:hypothetical protein [Kiritimatiellia bacterium]